MTNYSSKSILKKYRLCLFSIFSVFIIIAILLLRFTESNFLYGLFLIFAIVSIKISGGILYNKFFYSILQNELNLPKYIDVIKTANIVSNSLLEHLYIAYYSGDYNKAINICKMKLNDRKFAKIKHYYLLLLARSYFEIGDFESLSDVNEMFKSFVSNNKNGDKIKEKLIYFKFIDLYLSGDYTATKELYERLCLQANKKPSKAKMNDISLKFTLAICYYKCRDFSKSAELFNYIISTAPLLNYSEISRQYLQAIESNTEYLPEKVIIDTDTSDIPKPKSKKKIKILSAVGISLIVIGMTANVIGSIMSPKQPIHFKGLDYYSTKSDVEKLYGKPDERKEYENFKGVYYDIYCAEYLGVNSTLQITYYYNSDVVQSAKFTIDSAKYSNKNEYEAAVNKTYKYFIKNLSNYKSEDTSDEYGKHITWYNDEGGYSYSVDIMELSFSAFDLKTRECAVFEFTKYSE